MTYKILQGDSIEVMRTLDAGSVDMCVTSPPYFGLRSYLDDDDADKPLEIGLEQTPDCGRHGLMRLRRDITPDQLKYVVRQLTDAGYFDV